MKKIAFIILVAMTMVLFMGCNKEEPDPTPTPTDPVNPVVPAPLLIPNAVTDIEGNSYDAVQIGSQVWMAQNLRTHHYADSTVIHFYNNSNGGQPRFYFPDNDENNVELYGYLYNWPAAAGDVSAGSAANPSGVQGICPDGWHLPSDAEWTQLTDYLSSCGYYSCTGDNTAIAKALADTMGWKVSYIDYAVGNNLATNNATGFSARPSGSYIKKYVHFGEHTRFWSSTDIDNGDNYASSWPAIYRGIYYHSAIVGKGSAEKAEGYAVRCVKN